MKTPAPPPAPDPNQTAQAQSRYNVQSAQQQQQMNMVDQSTPWGSLSYSQSGTNPDGTPRYAATTSLAPGQQALFDQQNALAGRFGTSADAALTRANSASAAPMDSAATEARLMELGNARLQPALDRRRTSTESDLLNRGITMGSEAYRGGMERVTQGENDAFNQLLLTGRAQARGEMMQERQLPYQELAALTGMMSPVQAPQFQSTPQASVAAPDYQGAANTQYQGQLKGWEAGNQNRNAMLGGLFGLAGTVAGGALGGPLGASMGMQAGRSFGGWAGGR